MSEFPRGMSIPTWIVFYSSTILETEITSRLPLWLNWLVLLINLNESHDFINLTEIYRIQSIENKQIFGMWTQRFGISIPNKNIYLRRKNFNQIIFKAAIFSVKWFIILYFIFSLHTKNVLILVSSSKFYKDYK